MTDPTHAPAQDRASWRLVLDEGERLEVRPAGQAGSPNVALFMPAWRAADLARVMDAYSRMSAIFTETSEGQQHRVQPGPRAQRCRGGGQGRRRASGRAEQDP